MLFEDNPFALQGFYNYLRRVCYFFASDLYILHSDINKQNHGHTRICYSKVQDSWSKWYVCVCVFTLHASERITFTSSFETSSTRVLRARALYPIHAVIVRCALSTCYRTLFQSFWRRSSVTFWAHRASSCRGRRRVEVVGALFTLADARERG